MKKQAEQSAAAVRKRRATLARLDLYLPPEVAERLRAAACAGFYPEITDGWERAENF